MNLNNHIGICCVVGALLGFAIGLVLCVHVIPTIAIILYHA